MSKRRLVFTLREGHTSNEVFESFDIKETVKGLYWSSRDKYIEEHRYPLLNTDKERERGQYESYFYNSLGTAQKELYRTYVIDFDNDTELNSYQDYLSSKGESIESFFEDGTIELLSEPNDREFIKQREVFSKLQIEQAWDDAIKKGKGIIVSVIDSGVEPEHPDLKQNLWENPVTRRVGFVYDNKTMADIAPDSKGHGTSIAGIVSAAGNDIGVIGIAPRSLVQMHKLDLNGSEAFMTDASTAIEKSIDNSAKIINCSFGIKSTNPKAQADFVKKIKNSTHKAIFVFAAGNDTRNITSTFLNSLPDVLKVGALDIRDRIKNYSNFGRGVVYAYGDIHSTTKNGGYDTFSGTSAAAPQVAAICALMLSHNSTIPPAKLKEIIEKSCDKIAGIPSGFGRVNAKKAMQETMKISGRVLA